VTDFYLTNNFRAQTTFFASIEAGMLVPVNTDPNAVDALPALLKAANAGFLGALIMHVYAGKLDGCYRKGIR
jgi:hypothetical protein